MKKISSLLNSLPMLEILHEHDEIITGLSIDSRSVEPGYLFCAERGTKNDGHAFIDDALQAGARTILCEKFPEKLDPSVMYIRVACVRECTGLVASAFYDHPSQKLSLIGVTGTNGKTTTVFLLYQLLRFLGKRVAMISTAGDYFDGYELHTGKSAATSIEVIELQKTLAGLVSQKADYCCIEVSSHALDQGRVGGLHFCAGIFTNLTHDHLDYHGTMEAYARAKQAFFNLLPSTAHAIYNHDDPYGSMMIAHTRATTHSFGVQKSDIRIYNVHVSLQESTYELVDEKNGQTIAITSSLPGTFNVYNLTGVLITLHVLGYDWSILQTYTHRLEGATGRFEIHIHPSGVNGVIDYAHTPDALRTILSTLRASCSPDQKIFTVVGCGGDRDTTKRAPMADIALEYSDEVIFTSDNPRSEDPEKILDDMTRHLVPSSLWTRIPDRAEAIKKARLRARAGDIVLIAGKGHETYQEIKGVRYPFRDRVYFMQENDSHTTQSSEE